MVGGDHTIYVDFKKRYDLEGRIAVAMEQDRLEVVENLTKCQRMAGIALVDVSGHRVTDALLAAMFHQAFLLGAIYELDVFGGNHDPALREFEHAVLQLIERPQVPHDVVRGDHRGRFVPVSVRCASGPTGVLELERLLHGSR